MALGISGRIARFFLHSRLTPLIGLLAVLLDLFAVAATPRASSPDFSSCFR